MADAHHHNVIHRDLTPANAIIEDASGDVKLIDFGISIFKGAGVTLSGEVIGSPPYYGARDPAQGLADRRRAE